MKTESSLLTAFKVLHISGMLNKNRPQYIPQNHDILKEFKTKQKNFANSRNRLKKNERKNVNYKMIIYKIIMTEIRQLNRQKTMKVKLLELENR